jgi:hypothetical protein
LETKINEIFFSTGGYFLKLSESQLEFQGYLFIVHNPSELKLNKYVLNGKGIEQRHEPLLTREAWQAEA